MYLCTTVTVTVVQKYIWHSVRVTDRVKCNLCTTVCQTYLCTTVKARSIQVQQKAKLGVIQAIHQLQPVKHELDLQHTHTHTHL